MDPIMQALLSQEGGSAPVDPMALGGAAQAGPAGIPDPAAGLPPVSPEPAQGVGPQYPTTDPQFMGEMLSQIIDVQDADREMLSAGQQSALMDNPVFEAIMAGAPVGPGAGQSGQGVAMDPTILPGA